MSHEAEVIFGIMAETSFSNPLNRVDRGMENICVVLTHLELEDFVLAINI